MVLMEFLPRLLLFVGALFGLFLTGVEIRNIQRHVQICISFAGLYASLFLFFTFIGTITGTQEFAIFSLSTAIYFIWSFLFAHLYIALGLWKEDLWFERETFSVKKVFYTPFILLTVLPYVLAYFFPFNDIITLAPETQWFFFGDMSNLILLILLIAFLLGGLGLYYKIVNIHRTFIDFEKTLVSNAFLVASFALIALSGIHQYLSLNLNIKILIENIVFTGAVGIIFLIFKDYWKTMTAIKRSFDAIPLIPSLLVDSYNYIPYMMSMSFKNYANEKGISATELIRKVLNTLKIESTYVFTLPELKTTFYVRKKNIETMPLILIELEDVTSLTKLQRDLERKFSTIVLLTSMLSHDLKNSLTPILGYTEVIEKLIQKTPLPTDKITSSISAIKRNINNINQYLENVLIIGEAETEKLRITVEKVDLTNLFQELINDYLYELQAKKLRVDLHLPSDTEIFGDYWLLRRAFQNMFLNAIKYNKTEGYILITGEWLEKDQQKYIKISMENSGKGIPPEQLNNIFEPFERADQEVKGKGLGLYIVKIIVSAHNGRCWAESPGIDKGARFFVLLPKNQNQTGN